MPPTATHHRFRTYAWLVLAYNLLVIVWGGFVRASGSGAGCGSHWPLCNGEVLPRQPAVETLIELSHRLTSAVDGLLVLALLVWAWRAYPRRHPVRFAAAGSFVFLIVEALVGAGLVRFELVADNASVERAWVMAAHLVNTFLLVAFLALTAAWAARPAQQDGRRLPLTVSFRDPVPWALAGALAGVLLLGVSGAVAALGDTLFPVSTFREGLTQDLSPTAHAFVRLRIWHPALALGMAVLVAALAGWVPRRRGGAAVRRWARALLVLFALQLAVGLVNLALAAPVALQLVHLLMADLVWIALVLLSAAALAPEAAARPAASRTPAAADAV
jgi:heme A synthase